MTLNVGSLKLSRPRDFKCYWSAICENWTTIKYIDFVGMPKSTAMNIASNCCLYLPLYREPHPPHTVPGFCFKNSLIRPSVQTHPNYMHHCSIKQHGISKACRSITILDWQWRCQWRRVANIPLWKELHTKQNRKRLLQEPCHIQTSCVTPNLGTIENYKVINTCINNHVSEYRNSSATTIHINT